MLDICAYLQDRKIDWLPNGQKQYLLYNKAVYITGW